MAVGEQRIIEDDVVADGALDELSSFYFIGSIVTNAVMPGIR